MALHNATHLLVQQGLALVISRRRAAYVRYRELWVLSTTAHLVWILLTRGALHGRLPAVLPGMLGLRCSPRAVTHMLRLA